MFRKLVLLLLFQAKKEQPYHLACHHLGEVLGQRDIDIQKGA